MTFQEKTSRDPLLKYRWHSIRTIMLVDVEDVGVAVVVAAAAAAEAATILLVISCSAVTIQSSEIQSQGLRRLYPRFVIPHINFKTDFRCGRLRNLS